MTDLSKVSRRELILHATLLVRTINKHMTKEDDMKVFEHCTDEQLIDYIEHFNDPAPEVGYEDDEPFWVDEEPYTSATNRDYGPSNPWDAPGMSIRDFI